MSLTAHQRLMTIRSPKAKLLDSEKLFTKESSRTFGTPPMMKTFFWLLATDD